MNRKKKGKNKVMTIAIIGSGAVGTTLAVELKKFYQIRNSSAGKIN